MNKLMRICIVAVCIVCMAGCGRDVDSADYKQLFYEKLIKENDIPDRELCIHEVQDIADGKLIYAEWTGEGNAFELLYAEQNPSGDWEMRNVARHMPVGPLGSPGMVLTAGMYCGEMIVSIVVEEVHWNPNAEEFETWSPDHIELFFADGSSQDVEIHTGGRKLLILDEKRKITDWKLYTETGEEVYSYASAEKWNGTPVENLEFVEKESSPAPDYYRQLFYEDKMKDNRDPNRNLRIHEVQDIADGKLIYAEWVGEGPSFEISYAVQNAAGEWETREAGGHAPAGSPGMVVAAGICQGKMIVSIAAEEEHWNQDTDIRGIWNPDHIQLFFEDGSSQDVEIHAGGRKLLILDEKKKIMDWKLYTETGEEVYSYALAKKWDRTPIEELKFVNTDSGVKR